MPLPSELLMQIASDGGGRVVLIIGAGCSMPAPTSLCSGAWYSKDAYRRLVADHVLEAESCSDPSDLSELADLVFEQDGSQKALTDRLPHEAWRQATPNRGHLLAAALLMEGALRAVVTLNYDLALQTALGSLGSGRRVTIVRGPEEHAQMGSRSLVFLHRSVESPAEGWVMRKTVMEDSWRNAWESVVASGALSAPVTVFAGLGSPAAVLTESVKRLAGAVGVSYYLVDPYPTGAFATELSGLLKEVIQMGWCELASELAGRVLQEQLARLGDRARSIADEQGLPQDELGSVLTALRELSLVDMGVARARWMNDDCKYLVESTGPELNLIADVVLAIGSTARELGADVTITERGDVQLDCSGQPPLILLCAHGQGGRTWSSVQTRLEEQLSERSRMSRPRVVLVTGMRPEPSVLPEDLLRGSDTDDNLVRGAESLVAVTIDEIRGHLSGHPEELRKRLAS